MKKHILMIVTSAATMAPSSQATGIWLSEFAEPYIAFAKAGAAITVASPAGGKAPVDARSLHDAPPEFLNTLQHLERTTVLSEIKDTAHYNAVFLPGGHGTMFDLPENADLQHILRKAHETGKVLAAVCHGPAGLTGVKLADGRPLVQGKTLTAFTDAEEKEAKLDRFMPFLLESRLRELGADFVRGANWENHVEIDGDLITGQNPQSAQKAADAVLHALGCG